MHETLHCCWLYFNEIVVKFDKVIKVKLLTHVKTLKIGFQETYLITWIFMRIYHIVENKTSREFFSWLRRIKDEIQFKLKEIITQSKGVLD